MGYSVPDSANLILRSLSEIAETETLLMVRIVIADGEKYWIFKESVTASFPSLGFTISPQTAHLTCTSPTTPPPGGPERKESDGKYNNINDKYNVCSMFVLQF